jgi:hypothetical protein
MKEIMERSLEGNFYCLKVGYVLEFEGHKNLTPLTTISTSAWLGKC